MDNVIKQLEKENAELKAEIETLKKVKDFACINLNNYIADNNKLKAENDRLKEKLTNIERIAREGHKDYYYIYTKNNPFFLNIIKEIEK